MKGNGDGRERREIKGRGGRGKERERGITCIGSGFTDFLYHA